MEHQSELERLRDEQDDDEQFHTPRGRDLSDEPEVEWMYADASVLPLPGMATIAAANPLRWSRGMWCYICAI